MGGSTTTTESSGTSNQINQIPEWMSQAGQQNYALAQNIAEQPLQQYQGQMVADVSPQTQQAWNVAANSGNVGADQYNAATAGYLGALAQTPMNITPWHAGSAAPTVAAQGALAPNTVAAQAAAAQQAKLAAPTVASTAQLSQLGGMNLNQYMNPYTQSVIDKTLPIMNQSIAQQQNALANQSNQANAFGGSRQAIQQGVTGAQGALSEAQMAAGLNQANFQQAQQAGMFDVGQANQMGEFNANQLNQVGMYNQGQANQVGMFNAGQGNQVNMFNAGQANTVGMNNQQLADAMAQFNAGQSNQVSEYNQGQFNNMAQFNANAANTANYENQTAQQNKINSDILASTGLTNTGTQMNAANAANFNMLQSAGAGESMQAQDQINAQMAKFNQAFNYPQQQLGVLEGSLGMTPHDTSTSGQTQNQSATTTPTDWSGILESGLKGAASIYSMSDRSMKTDITKVDTHPSGVPIYTYRYKGDPKTYPKVMGPMAEDVAKIAPHAVTPMGTKGRLAVNMHTLNAFTPPPSPGVARGIQNMSGGGPMTPPSSRGVGRGIQAMGAFRPQGMAGALSARKPPVRIAGALSG